MHKKAGRFHLFLRFPGSLYLKNQRFSRNWSSTFQRLRSIESYIFRQAKTGMTKARVLSYDQKARERMNHTFSGFLYFLLLTSIRLFCVYAEPHNQLPWQKGRPAAAWMQSDCRQQYGHFRPVSYSWKLQGTEPHGSEPDNWYLQNWSCLNWKNCQSCWNHRNYSCTVSASVCNTWSV